MSPSSPNRWHKLDNTANLFPVIASRRFSNVYRLFITLQEPVDPELLQKALETVLPWFSAFKVRMRRGLFWRYFENNPATPTVQPEDDYPVQYIDPLQNNQFLFRVTYFERRINLEIFHVLTDGTGGMQFLQALCCQYLLLAHPAVFDDITRTTRWFASHATNTEDSYVANYTPTQKSTFRVGRATSLTGERTTLNALSVVHAYTPIKPLLALCRERQVSVTQYLTACIGWAVYTQQLRKQAPKYPVNIFLPVNLRNLFPSTTSLNFFSNVYISLMYGGGCYTFEDLLADVKQQFEEKITLENMQEKISYTVGGGNHPLVRMAPLLFKNIVLRAIFKASAKSSTLGFSNVGKVEMPPAFAPFVAGAGALLSCSPREPFKCAAASYNDILTFSFTSALQSPALQQAVVRQLTADGLDVTIETNGVYNENM
ncbi:hypothetical protein LJC61_08990 [Ruminococcaceae bacterium OttesenSCG-928-A16]|nr:hypothetical protein [Ruminococcaceae bacterium OttesenSCG-928-A16]